MLLVRIFGWLMGLCWLGGLSWAQPVLTYALNQAPTCGNSNGGLTLNASGGTPPYLFAFDGGALGSNNVFTNLSAGVYEAEVVDANQDTARLRLALSHPAGPTLLLIGITPLVCAGDSNGQIDVAASGGAGAPYLFALGDGPLQTNGTFASLGAGTYFVQVRDTAGCRRYQAFTLSQPSPVQLSLSGQTDVDCFGGNNGFLSLSASGGQAGGYQFSLDGTNFQASGTFAGLTAGSYQPVVEDADGCRDSLPLSLSQSAPIGLSARLRHDTCGQQRGAITLRASGGTLPLAFFIDGAPLPDSSLDNLGAGSYQAVATDAQGCSDTLLITLSDQAPPNLALDSLGPITCAGDADGYLQVQASGGTGSYQYVWPDLALNGPTLSNQPAGSYRAVVSDGICQDTLLLTLTSPPPLAVAIDSQRPPTCDSEPTGYLAVGVEGGVAPYQFQWSHDTTLGSSTAAQLAAGDYAVLISDARGCQDSLSVRLVNPQALRLSLETRAVRCAGERNGQATALVGGGIPPYQYQWNTGGDTARLSGLGPGRYEVVVTDQSGCTLRDSALIEQPAPLVITVETEPASCADSATGRAMVQASGGNRPYQYYWSDGSRDSLADNLRPGTYLLQVQDARQCLRDTLVDIGSPDSLRIEVIDVQASTCTRLNGQIDVQATGGTPGYRYQWNTPFPQSGPVARELLGGVPDRFYTVVVTDAAGCQRRRQIGLPDRPAPQARIDPFFEPDGTLLLSEAALYVSNQSEAAVAYRWRVNDSTLGVTEDLSYTATEPGRYHIQLVAYDAYFACPDTAEVQVTVVDDGLLWVPNAFSPNDDGHNDRFVIQGAGLVDFQLTIYDRWGKALRQVGRIDNSWDGRTATGTPVPEGAYAYLLQVQLNNGLTLTKRGQVLVIR
jgi:gliding motility-associated-like protein